MTGARVVRVTPAQVSAAKALLARSEITGRPVREAVKRIARAKHF